VNGTNDLKGEDIDRMINEMEEEYEKEKAANEQDEVLKIRLDALKNGEEKKQDWQKNNEEKQGIWTINVENLKARNRR